ncbi:MAG: UbiA family prenyltransferase [Thermoplasmata archaeon]|nr:MAG: UbiA family prenyltransferase [Thermoplasmata archaeon]
MASGQVQARLRLWRVQTLALTALVPVVGALVFLGEPVEGDTVHASEVMPELVLLFMTGAFLHIFGFVLNEWADLEVDRASADLQDKPLVSGDVSPEEAKWTAIVAGALTFVPLALVTLDPWPHLAMLSSLLLATAYDLWGKRLPLDLLLAGSITMLLMVGALALGGLDTTFGPHVTLLACVAGLQFLQNLYQNAIEGGIKDADHDSAAGAKTYAALLGVRIDRDGELQTGWFFTNSALAMKAIQIVLLLYTSVEVTRVDGHEHATLLWFIIFASIAVMVMTTSMMLPPVRFDRSRLKRIFSIHELATFAAIMTVIVPLVGGWVAFGLFILPMVWFMVVNRTLFGGSLEPGV